MNKTISLMLLMLLALLLTGTEAVHARSFRIMTFNIRLLTTVDSDNVWANRKDAVCKYLAKTKPDVFGLQEATDPQIEDIQKGMPDYDFVGVGREDGKKSGEFSPVFYNKKKYKLIRSGHFWLSETPDTPSLGWDAACKRICSWAMLQDNKSGKSFIYANTHLDHIGNNARNNGAMLIKERLSRMASNIPMMITGDFNVTDASSCYATMKTRLFPLNDAYKVAKKLSGMKSSFQDFGKIPDDKGQKIDFIFLSPSLKVKKAVISNAAIKNGRFLSDHNPHYADLDATLL